MNDLTMKGKERIEHVSDSDCISRQDAIEALGERPHLWTGGDYELGCANQYDLDRLAIETVPPAPPEEPSHEAVKEYCRKRGLSIIDTALLEKYFHSAQSEQRWIPFPCPERMPRDGEWCIFTDGVNISVERYKEDALDHFFPPGRWFSLEDAIAWMPLPAPYRKGGPLK